MSNQKTIRIKREQNEAVLLQQAVKELVDFDLTHDANANSQSHVRDNNINATPTEWLYKCLTAVLPSLKLQTELLVKVEAAEGCTEFLGSATTLIGKIAELTIKLPIKTRRVKIKSDWHLKDNGVILAIQEADSLPVVLLPKSEGNYEIYNPADGSRTLVDNNNPPLLKDFGVTFFRLLPEGKLRIMDLVKFSLHCYKPRDIVILILALVLGGAVSSVLPVISSKVFSEVVPNADVQELVVIAAMLIFTAMTSAYISLAKYFSMINLETKADIAMQSALLERLLSMPVTFFKQYDTGDLINRFMGMASIRKIISQSAITLTTGLITLVYATVLMFIYGNLIALIPIAGDFLALAILLVFFVRNYFYSKISSEIAGKMNGLLFQIISAMQKIKINTAEKRIFVKWSDVFGRTLKLSRQTWFLGMLQSSLLTIVNVIITAVFYYFVIKTEGITFASFVAFSSALGMFTAAVSSCSTIVTSLLQIKVVYNRVAGMLQAQPESRQSGGEKIDVQGKISFKNVNFTYAESKQAVLQDLNLVIEQGQYVAIVGQSGSGKSTVLRLILGFETPSSGVIYLDDHPLLSLNQQYTRRQFGVVLQDGQLAPGSIFENIIGTHELALDDAWLAAKLAAIDQEINEMPMKMYTSLSEGANTLSGGQKQRLLIAKALAKKPHIIFFDEATSSLDNISQKIIMENLGNLGITRLVIAHRLSTVKNADKIFVLNQGQVAESGTYAELMALDGLFAKLASKQESSNDYKK